MSRLSSTAAYRVEYFVATRVLMGKAHSVDSILSACTIHDLAFPLFVNAQQPVPAATVPRLVKFSGTAVNANGRPLSGITGITFSIYKDQTDRAPLWLETQSVHADSKGHLTVGVFVGGSDTASQSLQIGTSLCFKHSNNTGAAPYFHLLSTDGPIWQFG